MILKILVGMEIVYKKGKESNFTWCANQFKGKNVLIGFNKLNEQMSCEEMNSTKFNVQNVTFDNEITADLYLCYPLSVVVKETIKFKTLHELIQRIRQVYKNIYAEYAKGNYEFGIWGHSISDLVIESIRIVENKLGNPLVDVSIGS